ncbi:hypothetical protein [Staphylococcus phage LY01]|nr:hypothetical protein [Staphylococcus phage LY01]
MLNKTNKLDEMKLVQRFNKLHYQIILNNGAHHTNGPDKDKLEEIQKDINIVNKRIEMLNVKNTFF